MAASPILWPSSPFLCPRHCPRNAPSPVGYGAGSQETRDQSELALHIEMARSSMALADLTFANVLMEVTCVAMFCWDRVSVAQAGLSHQCSVLRL